MSSILIMGCGRVGLVTAACLAELGHHVTCLDADATKIGRLSKGELPLHEPQLADLIERYQNRTLHFSTNLAAAAESSELIFITVGTPAQENGDVDISQLESVARSLGPLVRPHTLIVEKSTVPVLTSDWIKRILQLNGAPIESIEVTCNPEFLREGTAISDFLFPERIVLGADSPEAMNRMRDVYRPLTSATYHRKATALPAPIGARVPPPLIETTTKTAELMKYACNCFLAMKLSYVNAIASICESVGADVEQLCAGLASDSRIGARFLSPGLGFGGSGFSKDLSALERIAERSGYDFQLVKEVSRINDAQVSRFLNKIRKTLWTLRGKQVAVLGLAYKGGTDDLRGSPAIKIVSSLLKEGCRIAAHDPAAMGAAAEVLDGLPVSFHRSPYDAARGSDALIILTDWPDFAELDLDRLRKTLSLPIVIDGRNLYTPERMREHGLLYTSVGRPTAAFEFPELARGASNGRR